MKTFPNPVLTTEQAASALDTAVELVRQNLPLYTDRCQNHSSVKDIYPACDNDQWTCGFWPGEVWLAYERTGEEAFKQTALTLVDSFAYRIDHKIEVDHHDMGFLYSPSCVAAYKLVGGEDAEFERIYQNGLANGADPDHPDYWGDTGDYDQCFVEMAAIACAILEVPEKVWTPLADRDRQNLAKWLFSINEHYIPRCNWLFFQVLVNLALDSVGMPADLDAAARAMDEVDTWYVADGWYSDGSPEVKPQKDYYIPWAIQYYGILYSVFAAERDPERAARYRQRAMEFGRQYLHWFDENGAVLPFGRSLSYRFAQCAFWSACVWAGLEPLPLPVMKGLIVRNFQWWLQKPILDRDGVLTVGYC